MRLFALIAATLLLALPARAEDNVLLIQTVPEGFRVWHVEGENRLTEEETVDLMAGARPEGGALTLTRFGMARAFELPVGVRIELLGATRDRTLLANSDACGHIQLWHSEGATQLSNDELTDLVLSALPDGGKRLTLKGGRYAKAFITSLGVTVTLWKKVAP